MCVKGVRISFYRHTDWFKQESLNRLGKFQINAPTFFGISVNPLQNVCLVTLICVKVEEPKHGSVVGKKSFDSNPKWWSPVDL